MADKRDEKLNGDYSNAVMTHTSDAIAASDFVAAKQDIEKNQKCNVKVKLLARCMDAIKKK